MKTCTVKYIYTHTHTHTHTHIYVCVYATYSEVRVSQNTKKVINLFPRLEILAKNEVQEGAARRRHKQEVR